MHARLRCGIGDAEGGVGGRDMAQSHLAGMCACCIECCGAGRADRSRAVPWSRGPRTVFPRSVAVRVHSQGAAPRGVTGGRALSSQGVTRAKTAAARTATAPAVCVFACDNNAGRAHTGLHILQHAAMRSQSPARCTGYRLRLLPPSRAGYRLIRSTNGRRSGRRTGGGGRQQTTPMRALRRRRDSLPRGELRAALADSDKS